jgi:hypothetical protein
MPAYQILAEASASKEDDDVDAVFSPDSVVSAASGTLRALGNVRTKLTADVNLPELSYDYWLSCLEGITLALIESIRAGSA